MTNDLINRAAAQQAIRALCDTTDCNIAIMPDVAEVLREPPAVDAVPVVHARWVRDNLGQPSCSACHMSPNYDGWGTPEEDVAICPSCGAIMDEEET